MGDTERLIYNILFGFESVVLHRLKIIDDCLIYKLYSTLEFQNRISLPFKEQSYC